MNLSTRSYQAELIDGEAYEAAEYNLMLSQLEQINHLSRGYAPTLMAIKRIARRVPGQTLKILDVGSGHGDTLREIYKWSRRQGIPVNLIGVDLNPRAQVCANERTPKSWPIKFVTGDVFEMQGEFDIVINSLMTHHLSDELIVDLLKWMSKSARYAWFINDLHRHPIAYYFIRYATRLMGYNRLIRHDAPLSVARGFSRAEWKHYLAQAQIRNAEIGWYFPFRFGILGWNR